MKNFLITFSIFIVWAFFALWLYSWLVPTNTLASTSSNTIIATETELPKSLDTNNSLSIEDEISVISDSQISEDTIAPVTINETTLTGLKAVNANHDIIFAFDDGISFVKNEKNIKVDTALIDYKYKINTYLIEHPDQEVHINSRYSANENIENPNLGIQRGLIIKNKLIETGVPAEKIVIKSIIKSLDFNADNTYNNAIDFHFTALNKERIANQIEAAAIIDVPESITFYPSYSETGVLVNKKLATLANELKQIVTQNPDLKITIIGHTDNYNNATENYNMGLVYAREIRWYLTAKAGIDVEKINAISKGEVQPIRSNKTKNGRRLNKRIEIKFQ